MMLDGSVSRAFWGREEMSCRRGTVDVDSSGAPFACRSSMRWPTFGSGDAWRAAALANDKQVCPS